MRNSLNALLYHTGSHSNNFMMVLATNRPQDLDRAVLDRIDENIPFLLPNTPSRQQLVHLYFSKYVSSKSDCLSEEEFQLQKEKRGSSFLGGLFSNSSSKKPSFDSLIWDLSSSSSSSDMLEGIGEKLVGFSGREISKLFISISNEMFIAEEGHLSTTHFLEAINHKILDHHHAESHQLSNVVISSSPRIVQTSSPRSKFLEIQTTTLDDHSFSMDQKTSLSPRTHHQTLCNEQDDGALSNLILDIREFVNHEPEEEEGERNNEEKEIKDNPLYSKTNEKTKEIKPRKKKNKRK